MIFKLVLKLCTYIIFVFWSQFSKDSSGFRTRHFSKCFTGIVLGLKKKIKLQALLELFFTDRISLTLRISDVYFPTWCMNFTALTIIFEPEYCQNYSKNVNFINSCVVWKLIDSAQVALTCPVLSVSARITKKYQK